MKAQTQPKPTAERLGPIDWGYDFRRFDSILAAGRLAQLEHWLHQGKSGFAATEQFWSDVTWKRVLDIGMYDGWPHGEPTPSVLLEDNRWYSWLSITYVRPGTAKDE